MRSPISLRRSGFTLIEMLIVMAVIAILATLLFPTFSRAREKARQSSCASNLKQIYTAFKMYAQDYDHKYPSSEALGGSSYRYVDDIYSMPSALDSYVKNQQIWFCPSMKQSMRDANMPGYAWVSSNTQLRAPDTFEDGTKDSFFVWDNYAYKLPSTKNNETANPTQWVAATEGRWCSHAGRTNFHNLYYDGHVKLYTKSTAGTLCKLQAS